MPNRRRLAIQRGRGRFPGIIGCVSYNIFHGVAGALNPGVK
jgi:hypothetical protein